MTIIAPGGRLGILGGGQLGRMLALAAGRMGIDVVIFDPEPDCPAARVAAHHVCAPYEDVGALDVFARGLDGVTFEFENVPVAAAEYLEAKGAPVRPGSAALKICQDRVFEKDFLNACGAQTVLYSKVDTLQEGLGAFARMDGQAVLKTRRMGYDGKGQARVRSEEDLAAAWEALGGAPAILEAYCPFDREISIVCARGLDGAMRSFDLSENRHRDHILFEAEVPARVSPALAHAAAAIAEKVLTRFEYVGVLAIEFFVIDALGELGLLANEIAPRVHNSGHWTPEICGVGQFEQHIRAVCGWPLGDPTRRSPALMRNLLGADIADWAQYAKDPNARLELYGKREPRDRRKMGHVTLLGARESKTD